MRWADSYHDDAVTSLSLVVHLVVHWRGRYRVLVAAVVGLRGIVPAVVEDDDALVVVEAPLATTMTRIFSDSDLLESKNRHVDRRRYIDLLCRAGGLK